METNRVPFHSQQSCSRATPLPVQPRLLALHQRLSSEPHRLNLSLRNSLHGQRFSESPLPSLPPFLTTPPHTIPPPFRQHTGGLVPCRDRDAVCARLGEFAANGTEACALVGAVSTPVGAGWCFDGREPPAVVTSRTKSSAAGAARDKSAAGKKSRRCAGALQCFKK